nr:MAG TPA: hypothetical protein [Caudoviricetes sp.]
MRNSLQVLLEFTLLIILSRLSLIAWICGIILVIVQEYIDYKREKEVYLKLKKLNEDILKKLGEVEND